MITPARQLWSFFAIQILMVGLSQETAEPHATETCIGGSGNPQDHKPPTTTGTDAWLRQARLEIADRENSYSRTNGSSYGVPNRSQGLQTRIGASGIRVYPRVASSGSGGAPWHLDLHTTGLGRRGDVHALADAVLHHHENRVDSIWNSFIEWNRNDEPGIEQGWTIAAPPPGSCQAPLTIEVEARGLRSRFSNDGSSTDFLDAGSRVVFHNRSLRAWDARGRKTAAQLTPMCDGFAIELSGGPVRLPNHSRSTSYCRRLDSRGRPGKRFFRLQRVPSW